MLADAAAVAVGDIKGVAADDCIAEVDGVAKREGLAFESMKSLPNLLLSFPSILLQIPVLQCDLHVTLVAFIIYVAIILCA